MMEKTTVGTMKEITERLTRLADPLSQYDYLLMEGIRKKADSDLKQDRFRIGGCKTAIWIDAQIRDGKVVFRAESDSLLVRGVLTLFDTLYRNRPAEEIRENAPVFLDAISDEVLYQEIKKNGLIKCYEKLANPWFQPRLSEEACEAKG